MSTNCDEELQHKKFRSKQEIAEQIRKSNEYDKNSIRPTKVIIAYISPECQQKIKNNDDEDIVGQTIEDVEVKLCVTQNQELSYERNEIKQ